MWSGVYYHINDDRVDPCITPGVLACPELADLPRHAYYEGGKEFFFKLGCAMAIALTDVNHYQTLGTADCKNR